MNGGRVAGLFLTVGSKYTIPKHPDFAKINVRKAKPFYYDPRFCQIRRGRN
jgi:hypothetical protein